uniref:Homeobox domain-containing protein n=1 Tax=Panagrolaimus sp. ES5 TaxID=591445 RepID=A0AC34F366_9BILA
MTSPTNGIVGGISAQQTNGTTPSTWDPSTTSSTSLNGSTPNIQPPFNWLPTNPNYFANSSFGSTNSYTPTDLSYQWNQWNAAAAASADPRFPKINVPTASSFNPNNIPFMASLTASMAGNAMRNSRRRRNLFSQNQVNELKRAFETEPYVKPETREKLAARTGLTPQQVKIWFQNNRYKCKQKSKEDERIQNRTSNSFNDSGSPQESPSSSGNELSMTATNSPDIKLNLGNDTSMIPMVHTHDATSDVKPIYHQPDFASPINYPMAYPYGYNMYNHHLPVNGSDHYFPFFANQKQQ